MQLHPLPPTTPITVTYVKGCGANLVVVPCSPSPQRLIYDYCVVFRETAVVVDILHMTSHAFQPMTTMAMYARPQNQILSRNRKAPNSHSNANGHKSTENFPKFIQVNSATHKPSNWPQEVVGVCIESSIQPLTRSFSLSPTHQ